MFQRALASCMIILVLTSSLGQGIFAGEISAINSLESLPYGDISQQEREKMIENTLFAPQKTPTTLEASLKVPEETMTLLSEKRAFEFLTPVSSFSSGLILDPFQSFLSPSIFAGTGILDIPTTTSVDISTGPLFQSEVPTRSLRVEKKIKKRDTVSSTKGSLVVTFTTGTVISTLSGDLIDPAKIGFLSLGAVEKSKAKSQYEKNMRNKGTKKKGLAEAQVEGFDFGLSGTHLVFSSPVELTVDTPNMGEGMAVDIMTLHAGDTDFHTGGLSTSAETLCNSDGIASLPGSQGIVKNGKVTFYTCGASSFTMNPTGGTAGSNDLRIIIGNCAQAQIYYNNLTQIYTGNPAATGCGLPAVWAALRIGGTTYGNGVDGVTATAWSTQSTTGSVNANTYRATSTMTRVVGGLTYTLIIDWVHTVPNKYLTWSYRVIIPAGNTANVRFYFANDSALAGADTNDTGYFTNTGGTTIGVYDSVANVLSAFRYLSGAAWTAYEAGPYATVAGRITGGTDFANTYISSGDLGFGVDWNFGTGASITHSGTVEWRLAPYVSANLPDLIPGIGAPEGPLTTNLLSQMPITVSNVGNLASSGVHTVVLTIPTNITGPALSFSDNGWSCGAQIGTGVTCTKTTAISAPTGNDTVRIPVTPTLAASGSNVTFNVAISNPGDSNITNNTAFSTNPVAGAATSDPGGITGENLWLQANSGTNCTTTGCTITRWANLGALGATASGTTGLGTVTYDPVNRINGNPTIYFNGGSLNTNNNLGLTARAVSIFTVSRIGSGGAFLIGPQTATNTALEWSTSPTLDRLRFYSGTTFYNGANLRTANTPAITSTTRIVGAAGTATNRTNGLQSLTAGSAKNWVRASVGIGRQFTTNATLSNLAEVIIYPSNLTTLQQNRVESYLAIKYGITLDQTTPSDYIYSNGTIVWSATGAGVFNNNITGIGRDDTSTLNQNRSQSVTNTGDIIVSKSSIGTNRMALMWAHDNTQIATFTGTDAPTGYQRMTREWLFQEKNGDLGTVNISYPATSIGTGFTAPLMLLADADSTFSSGASAYTGIYSTGTNTWDFSLDITDMQYIIFAKTVSTDTTPPNILSNSVASGTLAPIGTFPITLTYADTGSLINTGSLSGAIYAWDATGATWSPTNIAGTYLSLTSASTATGIFQLTGLPFGKYRFDFSIRDTAGNTRTQSYTYYIDGLTWTISAPNYSIGPAQTSIQTFGTGELLLTVQTVGAGFDLSMLRTADMVYLSDTITVYSGSTGWGYDKNIGSGYSSTITAHSTTQNIVSVAKNINTNGQKNTFTYRIKFGVNASANIGAGDYANGLVRFGINLTY